MSSQPLFIFATIKPKSEHLAVARSAVLELVDQTRSEPGCRQFHLHDGLDDGSLYLYEEWDSEDALAKHYEQPKVVAVFESYKEWLSQPPDVVKMKSSA